MNLVLNGSNTWVRNIDMDKKLSHLRCRIFVCHELYAFKCKDSLVERQDE